MAIENWIDALAAVWDEVGDGRGGYVKSYRCVDRAEFPEAIAQYPAVISYPRSVLCDGFTDIWTGVSEFHISESDAKFLLPEVIGYFARIRNAAMAHITLGGLVARFVLADQNASIQGPVALVYGSEHPHWGLVVNWTVKEIVTVSYGG